MKIANNYREVISLWEKEYPSLIGEWHENHRQKLIGDILPSICSYPFRQHSSLCNALIQIEDKDWDLAINLIKKFCKKKNKLSILREWEINRKRYENQSKEGQNQITLMFGGYILPLHMCFMRELEENTGYWTKKSGSKGLIELNESLKEIKKEYGNVNVVYHNIVKPLNNYFLCKQDLKVSESVMNMVRLELNNGGTLEQIASNIETFDKAALQLIEK